MNRLFLVLLLLVLTAPAHALRCGTRVVDTGDADFAVRERCGEPYWTEEFYSVDVIGADGPVERQIENVYDAWYYNFGPRRLMVRLLFLNGELQREETIGYGFNRIGDSCNIDSFGSGTSSGEIVARCGSPTHRRSQRENLVRRDGRGHERFRAIHREEWVYDLGDNRLLRILNMENGRLESIDTQGR